MGLEQAPSVVTLPVLSTLMREGSVIPSSELLAQELLSTAAAAQQEQGAINKPFATPGTRQQPVHCVVVPGLEFVRTADCCHCNYLACDCFAEGPTPFGSWSQT